MVDVVEKAFVRSFVSFLRNKLDSKVLSADSQESVEVAMQCLQVAFECEDGNETSTTENAASPELKDIDLFEVFQSVCLERNPDTLQLAEKIKNDGNQLMKDGKYNEALLQYNRAITFDPKNPIFYCNRAAAYIRLGDNERAITDCKTALVYNPNYGKAYGRLGIAYSNLGKFEEAQQAYAKAIELEPENRDYQTNLEVARNARSQNTQQHAAQSIPLLTEGLNILLNNPALTNLMNSAGVDITQLHAMSQNPMVMNAIGQMFSAFLQASDMPGGPAGGGAAAAAAAAAAGGGQLSPEIMQLFQSMSSVLANRTPGGANPPNNNDQPPPPPPST